MIKVNRAQVEMSGSTLELVGEISVAIKALADCLEKTDIPKEPVKKTLLKVLEVAFGDDDFESDEEEVKVEEEKTDTLDKVADLLNDVLKKLEERKGGAKNG